MPAAPNPQSVIVRATTKLPKATIIDDDFNPIPSSKQRVKQDLTAAKVLVYGEPGIGKSTLCSKFPGCLFLATEEGQLYLDIYEPIVIKSWDGFTKVLNYLIKNKPKEFGDGSPIYTLVIDTVDLLFQYACDYIAQSNGVETIGDMEWGKGWRAAEKLFELALTKISHLPYGLVLVGHSTAATFKSKSSSVNKAEPALGTTGNRVINRWADLILYCTTRDVQVADDHGNLKVMQQRVIYTQPSPQRVAKDRAGVLPKCIPLDYGEIVQYFPDTPSIAVRAPEEQPLEESDFGNMTTVNTPSSMARQTPYITTDTEPDADDQTEQQTIEEPPIEPSIPKKGK
jgi:hypothetical protein